jgi:hypothetical protein
VTGTTFGITSTSGRGFTSTATVMLTGATSELGGGLLLLK